MSERWSNAEQSNIDIRRGKRRSTGNAGALRRNSRGKKKKLAYQKEKPYSLIIFVAAVMILVYCGYMGYRGYLLKQTKASLEQEIQTLSEGVESEKNRSKELEQFEVYTHTKKYAEEFAKDNLSYVYPDEIIFKPED